MSPNHQDQNKKDLKHFLLCLVDLQKMKSLLLYLTMKKPFQQYSKLLRYTCISALALLPLLAYYVFYVVSLCSSKCLVQIMMLHTKLSKEVVK